MVHMAVRQQDIVDGYDLVGSLADIKADIQLRHRNNGLLAGYRVADDLEIVYFNMCQIVAGHSLVDSRQSIVFSSLLAS